MAALKRWTWLHLVAIVAAGIGLSYLAHRFAMEADAAAARGVLELRAEWRAKDLEHKIGNAATRPLAVAAFMASRDVPDHTAFQEIVAQVQDHPGDPIATILWAPHVKGSAREAFESTPAVRGGKPLVIIERDTDGNLVRAGPRDEYFPVVMRAAFEGDPNRLLGFDILSMPSRRAIAHRARDEGRPVATPATFLAGDKTPTPSYLVFWPVYHGPVPATVGERRDRIRGFVAGLFRVQGVLAAAIRNTPAPAANIHFFLGDTNHGADRVYVARYEAERAAILPPGAATDLADPMVIRIAREFTVLDQHWRVVFSYPRHVLNEAQSFNEWLILLLGLLLTALVTGYVYREHAQVAAVEKVVAARTADLRRANLEQERIIDASLLAIVVLDPLYKVLVWNRAAERMFGYRAEEVIGRPYPLVPDQVRPEFEMLFSRVAGGEIIRDMEVRRRRKDGKLVDVTFSGAPLYNADGSLRGAFFTIDDVTDRKATQQQLVQAQKMEAVGQLTGGIAHDFNNMLGTVIGNLDLARKHLEGRPEVLEMVDDALAGALRGAELVARLLAFSRKQPLQPAVIDLRKTIADLAPLLKRTLGEHIAIEVHVSEDTWLTKADPVQLENTLLNLAINARDAMPNGGRLSVECSNLALDDSFAPVYPDLKPGDYVVVSVSDTGTGMPPDVLARVFEPFFTTKRVGAGTGLGLSMVYGYMRQSGGIVKVYSEPGHGTTFRLFFPRAGEVGNQASALAPESAIVPRGHERILLVEDNPDVRKIATRILEDLGYDLTTAENADAAFALLQRSSFDLLFTDIVMPGTLNGLDLARRAREAYPDMRVLLTTGFSSKLMSDPKIPAMDAGLIVKPYREADLARTVRAALDSPAPTHGSAAAGPKRS